MDKLGINLVDHHEHTAVIVKTSRNTEKILYKNLLKHVLKVSLFIEEFEDIPKSFTIGINADKSFALIALTLGIIESGYSFSYMTKDDLCKSDDFGYFFSLSQCHSKDVELQRTLTLFDTTIYFYKSKNSKKTTQFHNANDEMNNVCYRISTSGTTGKKKLIHVTYKSIYSNLKSFSKIFKLSHTDVILSSAPVTFDVFVLDLLFTLHSGAAILFLENSLRFDPSVFARESDERVTFLQMTPTLFKQYGIENIQRKILHSESCLKYLVLGGEEFPSIKDVFRWQNWVESSNHKRIFNIYGITEMSCWALIHEVTIKDLKFGKIPLGKPLDDDTILAFNPTSDDLEELILITPTRVNFFDNNQWDKKLGTDVKTFAYTTNDLVNKIDGNIYWNGRSNDIVKRFGERVSLIEIENVAAEIIEPVCCIMVRKRIVLFYQSTNNDFSELLSNHLRLKLRSKSKYPDDIRRISFLPTCDHGKVSKSKLKELYKDILKENCMKKNIEEIFLEAINQMFNLKIEKPVEKMDTDEHDGKRMKYDYDSTFQQIGGSSFDALRIVMKIEDKVNESSNLLPKLLDNQHTIKDVFGYLKNLNLKAENGSAMDSEASISSAANKIKFSIQKRFDLEKCVDSTPSLIALNGTNYVTVGSHSGSFITINASDLSLLSTIKLGDRIECEAVQFKNFVVVGCYDGNLYCLDVLGSTIKCMFNSGAMIKSKPLVIDDEFIIFGNYNYDENLRCVYFNEQLDKFEPKWSKMLGKSGIFANILRIEDSCLACTLDGSIERLTITDGSTIWHKKHDFPIFSSPKIIEGNKAILFAEVMRKVHCIDYDGNELWQFDTNGHIFSSFLLSSLSDSVKITFGCHDSMLRCINFKNNDSKRTIEWETKLQSQIYGTPKRITVNDQDFIVSCSTNGYVNLIDTVSGKIVKALQLPGEIFSSCLVVNGKIFIGCRDNFVYCLSRNNN